MEGNDRPIRSERCDENTMVAFVSQTHRKVDIFWIDYKGNLVKYATLNNYGDSFPIQTFVTHPWTFKDAESGDQLVMPDKKTIYYPKPLEDNTLEVVLLRIPVYSLRDRCLQQVRKVYGESQIPDLEIPQTLKDDLQRSEVPGSILWDEYEEIG